MKKKAWMKFITFVLAIGMVAVMSSACSKTSDNDGDVMDATPGDETQAPETEEPAEILMVLPLVGAGSINDLDLIQEKVNEIALEKANVKVIIEAIPVGSCDQQLTLMLSGNEKLDLMVTGSGDIATFANRSQIIGLNDLLDEYGQDIKDALGDYLQATEVNGEIYALPTIRGFSRGGGFNLKTDLLEKYNIDLSTVQSLEDMTPILEKVHAGEGPDFPVLIISSPGVSFVEGFNPVDRLTDGNGVLLNAGQDSTEVVMYEETEIYSDMVHLYHDWYEAGYIQKDIVTSQETNASMLKAGLGFGSFSNCKPGTAENNARSSGVDLTNVQILPYASATSDVNNVCWAIAQNSENPAAAMRFLNLMWSDADINTLLTWGVEGTHYVINDEGFATYPEGVDASNSGWTLNASWLIGNQFLTPHWVGEQADLWELQKAANDEAIKSLAMGFNFDNTDVKTEAAAVEAVRSEYKMMIETGMADPDELLPEYIEKLKNAGIEKIIEEKQAQLDAWLASKN